MDFLRALREEELSRVVALLPPCGRILEIGAGSGWQARALAAMGYEVEAIDLDTTFYREYGVWPVRSYDGVHIPYPDGHFDAVFSSNVLEHIPHVEDFQSEIMRVLKPDGAAVHLVPTASWRLWTIAAYYIHLVYFLSGKLIGRRAVRTVPAAGAVPSAGQSAPAPHKTFAAKLAELLFLRRHGERGNLFSETWLFSAVRWRRLLRSCGWKVEYCGGNRLFYTGMLLLGPRFSIRSRTAASRLLGSSCHIFLLRKDNPTPAR